jgi:muconolactone delta-isomerase
MKIMATTTLETSLSPEQQRELFPQEAAGMLRAYSSGKIEQFWFRHDKPGVFFLMNVESVEDARDTLQSLTFVQRQMTEYSFVPVGPYPIAGFLNL